MSLARSFRAIAPSAGLISGAEAIAVAITGTASTLIVVAYVINAFGGLITPSRMALVGGVAAVALTTASVRRATWNVSELATFSAIILALFGWLMWLARPLFLPLAGGDLTHHLLLIQYIERHWRLAEPALRNDLNEFAFYTPGSHVLTALVGAWSGTNGFRVIHAVVSATVALKAGFVFLVARRILPRMVPRTPIAAIAAISLLASPTFFLGAMISYGFVAQVVCEWLAMAMWWGLVVWDQSGRREAMAFVSLAAVATFLTWPILLGPPLVVLGVLVILPHSAAITTRLREAALGVTPLAVIAARFAHDRIPYLGIVGAAGAVAHPGVHTHAWWFLAMSTIGISIATIQAMKEATKPTRRASTWSENRTLAIIVAAILVQSAVFAAGTWWLGREPYMAYKMFYFLICAQAVGVALAVGWLWHHAARIIEIRPTTATHRAAWGLTALVSLLVALPLAQMRQTALARPPATSLPLSQAGEWARAHIPIGCIEYLVPTRDTAYWLHLAVLGNPRRITLSDGENTYGLNPDLVAWPKRHGQPYAIADLSTLSPTMRNDFDILAQFGTAAVLRSREPASCSDP